jgi:lipopolysaccharide transport system ATP-binding protein
MTELVAEEKNLMLSVRNVGLSYLLRDGFFKRKQFWALKDVSFDLYRGDCLGVIGKNGAGKSSLLKMLANVVRPDHGEITNYNVSTSLLSLQLGFLPHLTGRENAMLGGMFQGLTKKEVLAKLDDIIEFAELQEFIDEPLSTYSSGMSARLGFALAFQVQPDVFLVDEVIGVGDAAFQERSMALMKERLRSRDTTIVFVSHSPARIKELCNRAVWIENHVLQCEGPPEAVLKAYSHYSTTGEFPYLAQFGLTNTQSGTPLITNETPSEFFLIDFSAEDSSNQLSPGWTKPKSSGRWSIKEKVSFTFKLNKPVKQPKIRLSAGTYGRQKVLVSLNGKFVRIKLLDKGLQDVELNLPADCYEQENEIVLQLPDRHSAFSMGKSDDKRELGILISRVEIEN